MNNQLFSKQQRDAEKSPVSFVVFLVQGYGKASAVVRDLERRPSGLVSGLLSVGFLGRVMDPNQFQSAANIRALDCYLKRTGTA